MRSATFLLVTAMAPAIGAAQDVSRDAYFGEISLSAGFDDDPRIIEMVAGGSVNLIESTQFDCNGFVSEAPDYQIDYSTGNTTFELSFFAVSEVDTILLINTPDGKWHCNDDYGEGFGLAAGITFEQPLAGIYDIWVGVYDQSDAFSKTELYITELGRLLNEALAEDIPSSDISPNGTPQIAGSGTAFAVTTEGHLVSNYHVVAECSSLSFQLPGALPIEATIISTNESSDLALLKVDSTTTPAPFRDQGRIRLGDEIVVYGFPLLGELSSNGNLTSGLVSALTGLGDDLSTFQISAQIQPGNSGGPVFDRFGAVVGVVVSTANQDYFAQQSGNIPQNVNFAITSDITQSFLRSNNIRYEVSARPEPLSTADIAEQAQSMTGALLCYR